MLKLLFPVIYANRKFVHTYMYILLKSNKIYSISIIWCKRTPIKYDWIKTEILFDHLYFTNEIVYGVRRSISKSSNNWINICKAIFIYLFYLLNYFNTHSSCTITYSCRYIMMKVLCNVFIFENYRQFKHTHGKMFVTPLQKKWMKHVSEKIYILNFK